MIILKQFLKRKKNCCFMGFFVLIYTFFLMLVLMINELSFINLSSTNKDQRIANLRANILSYKRLKAQETLFRKNQRPPDNSYNINVTQAENTPLERSINDSRPFQCRYISYDTNSLPTISVVIPFYNEALAMLLRTVHSILMRTPSHLLADIIIVNDDSSNTDLDKPLSNYVKFLPKKVKLIRMSRREGLIRARLTGARIATGTVVMFQDAHTENNVGWSEPLLSTIKKDHTAIVQPVVERIHEQSIQYLRSGVNTVRGGFSWDLRYVWMNVPSHEWKRISNSPIEPVYSPTLVGCAFAVNKEYFFKIGAFDEDMNVWGGENLELAFRNWMCGGKVLTHTCSRVGHVFKPFAYSFGGDQEKIVQKNLMRIAELWMGDYKKYFYASTYSWEGKHTYFTAHDLETLEKRLELKEQFKCKDFDWFLKTITPEIPIPNITAHWYGEVVNIHSEGCWNVAKDGYVTLTSNCYFHRIHPEILFFMDNKGLLYYYDRCLRIDTSTWLLKEHNCSENRLKETWEVVRDGPNTGFMKASFTFMDKKHEMCLMHVTNPNKVHKMEQVPQLNECNFKNIFQRWRWTYRFSFDYNFDKPV